MISILKMADEISNTFVHCWCKLVSNDGKVCLVCPQTVCYILSVYIIAVILVTPNETAKIITFQTTLLTF